MVGKGVLRINGLQEDKAGHSKKKGFAQQQSSIIRRDNCVRRSLENCLVVHKRLLACPRRRALREALEIIPAADLSNVLAPFSE